MSLFVEALNSEVDELDQNGIQLSFMGEIHRLHPTLQEAIRVAEARTLNNVRMKLTLDDEGKTPVKFFTAGKQRMTPEQISQIDWKDELLDINLSISSIFVNAGNWGCVATPQSILVRPQESCEFSGGAEESFD